MYSPVLVTSNRDPGGVAVAINAITGFVIGGGVGRPLAVCKAGDWGVMSHDRDVTREMIDEIGVAFDDD